MERTGFMEKYPDGFDLTGKTKLRKIMADFLRRLKMAIILRGKRKGEKTEIRQFCNNWIMCEDGKIYSPTSLQYQDDEIERLKKEDSGLMFGLFNLVGNRFIKKRIQRRNENE